MADLPDHLAAFMSYARSDDKHDDGQLSQFRERLSAEVRMQTGEDFRIFQDRSDIAWGQNWQQRIDEALDAVTVLLVIITPGFFRSSACRSEVERFLSRERQLGRRDLILPLYYVSAAELENPRYRENDRLAQELASRQFIDWRELRFEPLSSPVVRKELARLATSIRDVFWRQSSNVQGLPKEFEDPDEPRAESIASAVAVQETSGKRPPAEMELIFDDLIKLMDYLADVYRRGKYPDIREAKRLAAVLRGVASDVDV